MSKIWKEKKKTVCTGIIITFIFIVFCIIGKKTYDYNQCELHATELTDNNWTNGILNSNTTEILFNNTSYNYSKLENATKIFCNDEEYSIVNMDSDSIWIHVYVDRDATACGYPNVLTVE